MIHYVALAAFALAALVLVKAAKGDRAMTIPCVAVVVGLVLDVSRKIVAELVLIPAKEAGMVPYEGTVRAWFHFDQFTFLGWRAIILGLTASVFVKIPWWIPLSAWVIVSCRFASAYPVLRQALLLEAYGWVTAACVALELACVSASTLKKPMDKVGRPHLVVLFLMAGETCSLFGPWLGDPYKNWPLAQISWTFFFLLIAASVIRRDTSAGTEG